MTADGLSTGLNVMGPERGLALANLLGIPVFMIVKTADGFEERYSDAFKPYLKRVREVAMLTVFAATFVLFLLIVGGMSLGYVFKRKSLQGSCGGITALGMEKVCDCPEPCDARKSAKPKRHSGASSWTSTAFCSYSETRLWPVFIVSLKPPPKEVVIEPVRL